MAKKPNRVWCEDESPTLREITKSKKHGKTFEKNGTIYEYVGDEGAMKVDREPTSDEDALQLLQEIDPDELWEVKFYALVD